MYKATFQTELELIQKYLRAVLSERTPPPRAELFRFWECMNYSLLSEGKRFRPVLSLLTARALQQPYEKALPMAAAVELVHTYSLIHDDLPVMDNDDMRRGKPTNHKIFGDAQALLAGDALLTLSFGMLAESDSPHIGPAVRLLCQAAGPLGMVGGQVLDVAAEKPTEELLTEIHRRKTGALIQVAAEGTAVLLGADQNKVAKLRDYASELGLAFQLADDLQDFDPSQPEKVSYVSLLGLDETRRRLKSTSAAAMTCLVSFDSSAEGLRKLISFNLERA